MCERVPENPARTFRDALQAQWWGQMFNRIEQTSCAMGQGRWDQYLWPFYQKDIAEGRITKDSAMELLHCVWLHMAQCTEVKMNPVTAAGAEGFAKFEDVSLGGQTPDGKDATNDLTYLILESTRALSLTTPEPCIRVHANTPDRLLHHVAEVVKDGKGFPKLLNDEMIIPYYLANGASLEEALDWNVSGCCENRLVNRETNVTGNGGFNYGSAVEMTFRNGKLKVFNDVQFGVQTGDPRTWTSYDQVFEAFCAQVRHLAWHALVQQHVAMQIKPQYFAAPATSMLSDVAMAACRDLHTHGDYMPGAIDFSSCSAFGKATAIDSLAAVKTPHLRHQEAHLGPASDGDRGQLGRPRSRSAALPERAQVWQRHRLGRCHRARDGDRPAGVPAPAPQAPRPAASRCARSPSPSMSRWAR